MNVPPPAPRPHTSTPVALSIAGSDSGGGAGIQADLHTFAAFDVHGLTALTCLTAQSPGGVAAIHPVPPPFLTAQLDTLAADLPIHACKTGMLFSAPLIRRVAAFLQLHPGLPVVIDPVMVATSGHVLLRPDAVRALRTHLLPHATLATPNLDEAAHLLGRPITSVAGLRTAARAWVDLFGSPVLLKGGHLNHPALAVDVFHDGRHIETLAAPRTRNVHTHGTGCTYAAAITALLARGRPLPEAVTHAKAFITDAIRNSRPLGRYNALGWSPPPAPARTAR